jgi:hypothetical protein
VSSALGWVLVKKEIKRVQSRVQQKINMRYFYAFFSWTSTCIIFSSFFTINPKILTTVDKTTFEVHEIINSNVLIYFPKAYCAKTIQCVKIFSMEVWILSSIKLHFHDNIHSFWCSLISLKNICVQQWEFKNDFIVRLLWTVECRVISKSRNWTWKHSKCVEL